MLKILIVDDDLMVARSLSRRMITKYDVTIESDAAAAIAQIASADLAGQPYDVVVSDLRMPRSSGLEIARAARTHRDPPIFILASGSEPIGDCSAVDGFVMKPFCSDDLHVLIATLRDTRSHATTQRIRCVVA